MTYRQEPSSTYRYKTYVCSFSKTWAPVEICQRVNTCVLLKHTTQATPVQVSKTVPGTVAETALLVGGYQSSPQKGHR